MDKLREADAVVDALGKTMRSGEAGLKVVPALLVRLIDEDLWRDRVIVKTGERVAFDRFTDFVTTEPLEGLGADLPILRRLCCGNPEALDAIDRVTQNANGGDRRSANRLYNVQTDAPAGNSAARSLRKLRNQAPTLHQRVLDGELSPHAAMVEAGFRKKTMTIPADVDGIARAIMRRFDPDEIAEIIALLSNDG